MNGIVEATNKNIKNIIEKMIEMYKNWHEKLPFVMHAYQTTIQSLKGATPFSLAYGMEAVLPVEIEILSLQVFKELKIDEAEWVQSRYKQLNIISSHRRDLSLYSMINYTKEG